MTCFDGRWNLGGWGLGGWGRVGALLLALPACGDDGSPEAGTESSSGTAGDTSVGPTSDASLSSTSPTTTAADSSTGAVTEGSTSNGSGTDGTTTSDSGSDEGTGTTGGPQGACPSPMPGNPGAGGEVDVLFVVDNSGTMGEEQAKLATAIGAFMERLEGEGVDVRLAITTTDDGNVWCNATTPEAGHFVATSCRSRLADFVFQGAMQVDVQDEACLDVCAHDQIALEPTTTANNPVAVPHPWLEVGATTNLPAGLTAAEAAACLIPQGINGCGFERPLESMYKALLRAQSDAESQYDFLRTSADLMVVFVTDEVDCSHRTSADTIFLPDGQKAFWSDPDAPAPTSALCWNAGVECTGGPGEYDDCISALWDESGAPTDENGAVMHPVSRYVDLLAGIEAAKAPGTAVRVEVITGVPEDYAEGGSLVYADSVDPQQMLSYGIGPGCTSAEGDVALPPVRLREVAEAFAGAGEINMDSVCAPTWCEIVDRIADAILQ